LGVVLVALLSLNGRTLLHVLEHGRHLDRRLEEVEVRGEKTVSAAEKADLYKRSKNLEKKIVEAKALIDADAFRWTELLDRLERLLPGRVRIVGLVPEYREGSLRIQGEAMEIEALQSFLDALLKAEPFHQAYLLEHKKMSPPATGLQFSLVVKGVFSR